MGSIANEAIRRAALSSRVASRLVAAPVFVASLAPSSSSSFSSAPLPRPRVETLSGRSSSRVASSLARKRLFVFSSPNPTNYSAPLATHAAAQRKPASQPLGEVWLAGWLAELPAGSIYLTAALSPASSSSAAGFIGTKSSWPLGGPRASAPSLASPPPLPSPLPDEGQPRRAASVCAAGAALGALAWRRAQPQKRACQGSAGAKLASGAAEQAPGARPRVGGSTMARPARARAREIMPSSLLLLSSSPLPPAPAPASAASLSACPPLRLSAPAAAASLVV